MNKFNIGDEVMVSPEVKMPHFGWGAVKPGDVGVFKKLVGTRTMFIDFPNQSYWKGVTGEMVLVDFSLVNE